MQSQTQEHYMYVLVGSSLISIDECICFGTLCVVRECVVMLQLIATGPSGKSVCEALGWTKFSSHDEFVRFQPRRPLDEAEWNLRKPNVCADAQS